MANETPVELIDRARADYAAERIDRPTALERIRSAGLDLTRAGAVDLLDHRLSAAERYAAEAMLA